MAKSHKMPDHHSINSLITALFIAALPHFVYQPLWVGVMFVVMIGWRLLHSYRAWPLPAHHRGLKLLHNGLALAMILVLFSQFSLTIGLEAGAALLTIMLAFKLVELQSLRDYYLSCFLGFFLVITNFFYSQSIFMVLLMLVAVILLTSCLLSINSSSSILGFRQRLKLASKMVIQSIPVMLLLFVLFPRIPGPLWGVPDDANQSASTGISDSLTLGQFSQLSLSDDIAFRVAFAEDRIPASANLYWRGPVLWNTDGQTWSPASNGQLKQLEPQLSTQGEAIDYTMTLEPHDEQWLFALDMPTVRPEGFLNYLTTDGRLLSGKPIKQRKQYQLVSYTDYRFNPDTDPNLEQALQLPKGFHPQTLELANQWLQQTNTPGDFINRALQHFNQEAFSYSLSPPALSGDGVDQFLFETREGFCEHYAVSFTVLMRAAGIPARVVTGYLGGEVNPVDNVLIVRQRDAHAWVEVWLKEQGWVRIDPTSAVSSERIETGMTNLLPAERRSPLLISNNDALLKLWYQMRYQWDAFNTAWDIWVVAFGPEKQVELLSMLGMKNPDWKKMAAVLALLLALTGIIMLLLSYARRPHPDRAVHLYQQFCSKLARVGVSRQAYEGPCDFATRAQRYLPNDKTHIAAITEIYNQLRYNKADHSLLLELESKIKQFRPKR